jgi:DNA ligase D-like protein (predicted 3'-phosphoesterase)
VKRFAMPKKDPLQDYKKKRDFKKTTEPSGKKSKKSDKPIFVIQKHDARNLHYDLRLEVDGVLKSWAVPKGPSTDPKEKRLAVPTEDHPMDYAEFEGVIPEGEYGGGTVMVWDKGTYRNLRGEKDDNKKDMSESLEDGKVEFWLEGEKLQGGYVLIRTGKGKNVRWLLKKMKDEKADARRNPISTQGDSVLTGRSIKEIAEEEGEESD